jgi:hypothetical protein
LALVILLTFNSYSSSSTEPSVSKLFNQIEASFELINKNINETSNTNTDFKSFSDTILKKQIFIQSILICDKNGKVLLDNNQDQTQIFSEKNMKKSAWFTRTLQNNDKSHFEIVKVNTKKILLKSWIIKDKSNPDDLKIVAVLIDLEKIIGEIDYNTHNPVALLFNGHIIYESNWIQDASEKTAVPTVGGLEIAIAKNQENGGVAQTLSGNSLSLVSDKNLFWIILILSLFIGVAGIVWAIFSKTLFSKLKNDAYLRIEEEKLSDVEKDKIHKMAVSHVYCEVKRQVETHELKNIEMKVRSEIASSVREHSTPPVEKKAELHTA